MTPIDTLLKFIDPAKVYPPLLAKYRAVLDECAREGAEYYATCGYRSPDQQTSEYLKGREIPGPNATPTKPLGDTVTRARAYGSFHQYGIAIDSTRDGNAARAGLQPSWKAEDYAVLARVAGKHGLRSLGPSIGDWPHVELPIENHGLTLNVLRVAMKAAPTPDAGLKRVWAMLDERGVLRSRGAA